MSEIPPSSSAWSRAGAEPPATGHYGAGYGDPVRHWGDDAARGAGDSGEPVLFPEAGSGSGTAPRSGAATDPDYARWRLERLREFDADYDAWRRERYAQFCAEFEGWRREVQRARATSAEPSLKLGARDDGAPTEHTAVFFERS